MVTARRTVWSSWGENRGVKNANDERKLMLGDFFLNFWPQLALRKTNCDSEIKIWEPTGLVFSEKLQAKIKFQ